MTNTMKAYAFASRCRVRNENAHRWLVVEDSDFSFSCLVVILVASIDAAVNIEGSKIGQSIGNVLDVANKRRPNQYLFPGTGKVAGSLQYILEFRTVSLRENTSK